MLELGFTPSFSGSNYTRWGDVRRSRLSSRKGTGLSTLYHNDNSDLRKSRIKISRGNVNDLDITSLSALQDLKIEISFEYASSMLLLIWRPDLLKIAEYVIEAIVEFLRYLPLMCVG